MTSAKAMKEIQEFEKALKRHLDGLAKETGRDMHRLRREVAFEAFLSRLQRSGAQYVIKGAFALEMRSPLKARATQDIDIMFRNKDLATIESELLLKELTKIVVKACNTEGEGDPFKFELVDVKKENGGEFFSGYRFFVAARLKDRNFERFLLDVGVGDAIYDPIDVIPSGRSLMALGIPTADQPVLTREQHFSEKIHAYTRPREGENSRVKDLIDLVILIRLGLDSERLMEAMSLTFSHCATHVAPLELAPPPKSWEQPFARFAREAGLDYTMATAYVMVRDFYADFVAPRLPQSA